MRRELPSYNDVKTTISVSNGRNGLKYYRRAVGLDLTWLTWTGEDDGYDETVNTEHTRHDDGDNVTHHQAGVHDTHGRDTHAGLGGTVSGADVWT